MAAETSEPEAYPAVEDGTEGDELVDNEKAQQQMQTMLQNFWVEQMKEVSIWHAGRGG